MRKEAKAMGRARTSALLDDFGARSSYRAVERRRMASYYCFV